MHIMQETKDCCTSSEGCFIVKNQIVMWLETWQVLPQTRWLQNFLMSSRQSPP